VSVRHVGRQERPEHVLGGYVSACETGEDAFTAKEAIPDGSYRESLCFQLFRPSPKVTEVVQTRLQSPSAVLEYVTQGGKQDQPVGSQIEQSSHGPGCIPHIFLRTDSFGLSGNEEIAGETPAFSRLYQSYVPCAMPGCLYYIEAEMSRFYTVGQAIHPGGRGIAPDQLLIGLQFGRPVDQRDGFRRGQNSNAELLFQEVVSANMVFVVVGVYGEFQMVALKESGQFLCGVGATCIDEQPIDKVGCGPVEDLSLELASHFDLGDRAEMTDLQHRWVGFFPF